MIPRALCELCFSFRQVQSHIAQGGLELTEIRQPASTAWPLWLTSGLALHSSGKLYLLDHKQNITTYHGQGNLYLFGFIFQKDKSPFPSQRGSVAAHRHSNWTSWELTDQTTNWKQEAHWKCDIFPPTMPHLLNVPQTTLPTRDQVFKCPRLCKRSFKLPQFVAFKLLFVFCGNHKKRRIIPQTVRKNGIASLINTHIAS